MKGQQTKFSNKVMGQDSWCDKDGTGPIDPTIERPYSLCKRSNAEVLVHCSHGKTSNKKGRKTSTKGSWKRRAGEQGNNDVQFLSLD